MQIKVREKLRRKRRLNKMIDYRTLMVGDSFVAAYSGRADAEFRADALMLADAGYRIADVTLRTMDESVLVIFAPVSQPSIDDLLQEGGK